MGRPVDQEKRRAVLEAASAAFVQRGYEATSIDVIADSAGVARRTVYHQFGSKEGLFAAVVETLWGGLRFDEPGVGDTAPAARDVVLNLATTVASYWRDPAARGFLRFAIIEGARAPGLRDSFFRKGKQPTFKAMAHRLAALSKSGHLSPAVERDPELAAHQLIGLVNEPLLWPQLLGAPEPGDEDYERAIAGAVEMFMARYGMDL